MRTKFFVSLKEAFVSVTRFHLRLNFLTKLIDKRSCDEDKAWISDIFINIRVYPFIISRLPERPTFGVLARQLFFKVERVFSLFWLRSKFASDSRAQNSALAMTSLSSNQFVFFFKWSTWFEKFLSRAKNWRKGHDFRSDLFLDRHLVGWKGTFENPTNTKCEETNNVFYNNVIRTKNQTDIGVSQKTHTRGLLKKRKKPVRPILLLKINIYTPMEMGQTLLCKPPRITESQIAGGTYFVWTKWQIWSLPKNIFE